MLTETKIKNLVFNNGWSVNIFSLIREDYKLLDYDLFDDIDDSIKLPIDELSLIRFNTKQELRKK